MSTLPANLFAGVLAGWAVLNTVTITACLLVAKLRRPRPPRGS